MNKEMNVRIFWQNFTGNKSFINKNEQNEMLDD